MTNKKKTSLVGDFAFFAIESFLISFMLLLVFYR